MVKRALIPVAQPLEPFTFQPPILIAELERLYSSMNSSLPAFEPRVRNSLMTTPVEGPCVGVLVGVLVNVGVFVGGTVLVGVLVGPGGVFVGVDVAWQGFAGDALLRGVIVPPELVKSPVLLSVSVQPLLLRTILVVLLGAAVGPLPS